MHDKVQFVDAVIWKSFFTGFLILFACLFCSRLGVVCSHGNKDDYKAVIKHPIQIINNIYCTE